MKLGKVVKHIRFIMYHKWLVFRLCCKAGEPWRGFMHDWSKFSPEEFFESVKYYNGKQSPLSISREINGISNAWLHHKGRNKHHLEYWVDDASPMVAGIMPYKYAVEMICDRIASGMAYEGKNFSIKFELDYWNNEKKEIKVNPKMDSFITEVFGECMKNGIDNTLKKKTMKKIYENNVNNKTRAIDKN